jgi:plastocyanin
VVATTGLAILALVALAPVAALAADARTITMAAAAYSPVILTVEAGTTITFENSSTFPHTATAEDGSFDTGAIAPGSSKSIVVSTPGTFPFFCQFHGAAGGVGQAGNITVTAAPAPTPAPAGNVAAPVSAPGGPLPTTATVFDLPGFADISGIALGLAVVLAVALALVIDTLRGRSSRARTE